MSFAHHTLTVKLSKLKKLNKNDMKRLVLMIVSALICGVMVFISSCSKEEVGNSALSIYAFGQSTTRSSSFDESEKEEKKLWCTGNDIKWYDATTGELKLKNIPKVPYMTFFKLTIFLDEVELFSLETANPYSSISTDFPCINWDMDGELIYTCSGKCGNKQDHIIGQACEIIWEYTGDGGHYYISKGYPRWHPLERDESTAHWDWDSIDADREENWKTLEPGWSTFIEQLKKEGKYKN